MTHILDECFDDNTYYYVTGPCGSRKSTAAIDYICKNQHAKNHVLVLPTEPLIKELAAKLGSMAFVWIQYRRFRIPAELGVRS